MFFIFFLSLLFQYAEKASSSLTNVILQTHRKKHYAYLIAESANKQDAINNNTQVKNVVVTLLCFDIFVFI